LGREEGMMKAKLFAGGGGEEGFASGVVDGIDGAGGAFADGQGFIAADEADDDGAAVYCCGLRDGLCLRGEGGGLLRAAGGEEGEGGDQKGE
jgi:hypothetical protein